MEPRHDRRKNDDIIFSKLEDLDKNLTEIRVKLVSELGSEKTPGNVNRNILDLSKEVDRLNTKSIEDVKEINKKIYDKGEIQDRIFSLERWQSGILACIGLIVFLTGTVISLIAFFKK